MQDQQLTAYTRMRVVRNLLLSHCRGNLTRTKNAFGALERAMFEVGLHQPPEAIVTKFISELVASKVLDGSGSRRAQDARLAAKLRDALNLKRTHKHARICANVQEVCVFTLEGETPHSENSTGYPSAVKPGNVIPEVVASRHLTAPCWLVTLPKDRVEWLLSVGSSTDLYSAVMKYSAIAPWGRGYLPSIILDELSHLGVFNEACSSPLTTYYGRRGGGYCSRFSSDTAFKSLGQSVVRAVVERQQWSSGWVFHPLYSEFALNWVVKQVEALLKTQWRGVAVIVFPDWADASGHQRLTEIADQHHTFGINEVQYRDFHENPIPVGYVSATVFVISPASPVLAGRIIDCFKLHWHAKPNVPSPVRKLKNQKKARIPVRG
jgi:hypothetical protein